MKKVGRYQYADAGKQIVMTLAGMESSDVRKAYLSLQLDEDDPPRGLGKVPASWVEHGWVIEEVK